MAKFPFKRLRVISKKFPQIDSHVESVSKSLEGLVFSYSEQVEKALHKKHILMAISSLAVLIVLGSFITPTGRADNTIFYPKTCLGGWSNPHNAEGEGETSSNGDPSQFSESNSAVLPQGTEAEIYCGNFIGTFDEATRPTKILVSLAMTQGEVFVQDASSTLNTIEQATTTEQASTTQGLDLLHSGDRTQESATTSTTSLYTSTTSEPLASEALNIATTSLPTPLGDEVRSVVGDLMEGAINVIGALFGGDKETSNTDTVIVPAPEVKDSSADQPSSVPENNTPSPEPKTEPDQESKPVSFMDQRGGTFVTYLMQNFFVSVFAEDLPTEPVAVDTSTIETSVPKQEETVPKSEIATSSPSVFIPEKEVVNKETSLASSSLDMFSQVSSSSESVASSTESVLTSATTSASSTELILASSTTSASSTELSTTTATIQEEGNRFQNNFLEVLYTFDGTVWQSLGELNEISMKYRTFEIPVTASTTWTDMSQLQIKIQSRKYHDKEIPLTYLDSIKVDVLYESTMIHVHPDFTRDTILRDETIDNLRIVTIINNDSKREELWYMYLDAGTSTGDKLDEVATSSAMLFSGVSTTTEATSTSLIVASTSDTLVEATSSLVIQPIMPRNVWYKFEGKAAGKSLHEIVLDIKIIDKERLDPEESDRVPDFTKDTLIRIRGVSDTSVVVQISKVGVSELWLYNLKLATEEKINTGTSSVLSETFPIAIKESHLFFMSGDETEVIAYNLLTKTSARSTVPLYDGARGERAEVFFEGFPWKIIVSPNSFSFFSEQTGEVFSDENGTAAEQFRSTMLLDSILNKEQLSDFNFQVEASEGEEGGSVD